jgi:hypothetical protein
MFMTFGDDPQSVNITKVNVLRWLVGDVYLAGWRRL